MDVDTVGYVIKIDLISVQQGRTHTESKNKVRLETIQSAKPESRRHKIIHSTKTELCELKCYCASRYQK